MKAMKEELLIQQKQRGQEQELVKADLRVVDVYVARLRGKLEPDPRNPELILTVRGIGYSSQRVGEAATA